MKSEHNLHQQVGCTCCWIVHHKLTVLQLNRSLLKCSTYFVHILQTSTLPPYRVLCQAFSMPSIRLVFLTALLVVLMAGLTSSSRATRRPKPQSTKKPPRAGSSGGGFAQTTTMTTSPSGMPTDETTEVMMDTYSLSPTDSNTYSSDTYPTDFHTDAVAPPGNTHGNYTLDYNECFFNYCECCPPERGPLGPMGEIGPPGPPGERGPLGKMDYHFQENYILEVKIFLS